MKKYPHVLSKLFYEPLVITRARHQAICRVVESHLVKVETAGEDLPIPEQPEYASTGGTAIIPINGVIVPHASDIPLSSCGCGLDTVHTMIDVAMTDQAINRIVFNFNSPGGSVVGLPEMGRRIAGIVSKETVGFTDSECCSGALWMATQCQRFYSTESAMVGSIGVWCAYLDLSRQMMMNGENMQEFFAGKYKTMGAWWKPLTREEADMIQARVDKIYRQFSEAINNRRTVSEQYMQGQVFDGPEAVEAGLLDGTVDSLQEIL